MAIKMDVNTDALVVHANKLEKLNKTAFPNAVRTALNSAAFDVKKDTLLESASKSFIKRQPNFFRANSRVKMADLSSNVNNMESTVGMRDLSGNNHAVKDLEQQEHGGTIGSKTFIPLDTARTGKNYRKKVSKKNRMSGVRNVVNAKNMGGRSTKQNFVKAIHVAGAGGHVLHMGILWRVESVVKKRSGMFRIKPIYSFKKGRSVSVKATHFMENASLKSAKKLDEFFIKAARTQFNRALK